MKKEETFFSEKGKQKENKGIKNEKRKNKGKACKEIEKENENETQVDTSHIMHTGQGDTGERFRDRPTALPSYQWQAWCNEEGKRQ